MGASDPTTPAPQPAPGQPLPVQSLDYRTPPPSAGRRTLVIVLVILGLGLIGGTLTLFLVRTARVAVATSTIVITPTPAPTVSAPVVDYEQMRRQEAYDDYLSFAARPNVVVYDEDPVRAVKLLTAQPQKHRQTSYGSIDPGWASSFDRPVIEMSPGDVPPVQPFIDSINNLDRVTLFVGKLRSPGGNARLVFLDMRISLTGGRRGGQKSAKGPASEAEYEARIGRKLEYRIYDAGPLNGFPTQLRTGTSLTVESPGDAVPIRWIDGTLRADRPATSALQFFAGMLDAADPSHCTIDYDLGGRSGVIDVYLTHDDYLRILPRAGRVTGGKWEVGAAPAAGESVERPATQLAP